MTKFLSRFLLGVIAAACVQGAVVAAESTDVTAAYAAAQKEAKASGKNVLLHFTGSDWCPPCKALEKQVLSTSDWKKLADKNFVSVEVDFPKIKKLPPEQMKGNEEFAEKFKVEGFPTIVVVDPTGKELARTVGYESGSSVADFAEQLKAGMPKG